MRCPFCSTHEDKVIETRVSKDGTEIRRRRECEGCSRRYTTYERIEESMPLVIKNDGRREPFDRAKIEHGIQAAVAKRPVPRDKVAGMALEVEREIAELSLTEIASRDIGERVLLGCACSIRSPTSATRRSTATSATSRASRRS